jgi:transcriptional regulator with XRE-family HTH domain
MSQSRLSRIERGAFLPTANEIETLCGLYNAPANVRRELLGTVLEANEERSSARVVLQRGAWRMQDRIRALEENSRRVRSFQPVIIVGLLQTSAYMHRVFGGPFGDADSASAEAARRKRQQLLHSDREFTLLMSEGALRWNLGGPSVMVPQLEYLIEVTRMPNVRLGIIPWFTAAPLPPLHGFHLYDSASVMVGTLTATALITDARDMADYQNKFDELEHVASFGDDARSAIDRVAQDFRGIS